MIDHDETRHDSVRETVATGHPQVDQVLGTLETLPDLPVEQHVAVFEAAHVGLRDALDGAGPAAADRG